MFCVIVHCSSCKIVILINDCYPVMKENSEWLILSRMNRNICSIHIVLTFLCLPFLIYVAFVMTCHHISNANKHFGHCKLAVFYISEGLVCIATF
jgi:hypothetical protein